MARPKKATAEATQAALPLVAPEVAALNKLKETLAAQKYDQVEDLKTTEAGLSAAVVWGRRQGVPTPRILTLILPTAGWERCTADQVQVLSYSLPPQDTESDKFPQFALVRDGDAKFDPNVFDLSYPPHQIDKLPAVTEVGEYKRVPAGSDRFTADIDFAAGGPLVDLPEEEPLSFGGYKPHTPSGVPVDWIVRSDDYQGVFEAALDHPRRIDGVPVPVVSPEYLLAMKMVARRRKDEVDLETLLELGAVNHEEALRIVKKLLGAYAADELRSHIDLAEWNRSKAGKK